VTPHEATALRDAIEHTRLAATATSADVERLCVEAVGHELGGVCVLPVHVAACATYLRGTAVRLVTVIGFPLGANRTETKVREAELALADGAHELDMVMCLARAKAGDFAAVRDDIAAVVGAARGAPVKVILETGVLDEHEKRRTCEAAVAAGAAYVKTCTGYGPGRATVEDVRFLADVVRGRARVKASGGIRTLADARALFGAGATRLGTSAGAAIAEEIASAATQAGAR
jgi:deoxyribose-phosphate aldolase